MSQMVYSITQLFTTSVYIRVASSVAQIVPWGGGEDGSRGRGEKELDNKDQSAVHVVLTFSGQSYRITHKQTAK